MKTRKFVYMLLAVLSIFGGCASGPTYDEQLSQIPVAKDEKERQKVCTYLRSEIARMQNIAAYGSAQSQQNFALYGVCSRNGNNRTLRRPTAFNKRQCKAASARHKVRERDAWPIPIALIQPQKAAMAPVLKWSRYESIRMKEKSSAFTAFRSDYIFAGTALPQSLMEYRVTKGEITIAVPVRKPTRAEWIEEALGD